MLTAAQFPVVGAAGEGKTSGALASKFQIELTP